jgi:uncharacterized cupin superfamily protein
MECRGGRRDAQPRFLAPAERQDGSERRDGEEELSPGDFVFCPEGRAGLHAFFNHGEQSARILAMSAGSFPDVVAYPEHGYAWVATRDPEAPPADGGDPGIIARFEIPTE